MQLARGYQCAKYLQKIIQQDWRILFSVPAHVCVHIHYTVQYSIAGNTVFCSCKQIHCFWVSFRVLRISLDPAQSYISQIKKVKTYENCTKLFTIVFYVSIMLNLCTCMAIYKREHCLSNLLGCGGRVSIFRQLQYIGGI